MTQAESNRQKIRFQNKFGKVQGKAAWKAWLKEKTESKKKED